MTGQDARFVLTAALDRTYGHEGDTDYYAETVGSGGLLEKLLYRAAQLDQPSEELILRDDIVVIITDVIESSLYYYHTVEIILPDQSFFFDLNTDVTDVSNSGFDDVEMLRDAATLHRNNLMQAITINDLSFSEFAGKTAE